MANPNPFILQLHFWISIRVCLPLKCWDRQALVSICLTEDSSVASWPHYMPWPSKWTGWGPKRPEKLANVLWACNWESIVLPRVGKPNCSHRARDPELSFFLLRPHGSSCKAALFPRAEDIGEDNEKSFTLEDHLNSACSITNNFPL